MANWPISIYFGFGVLLVQFMHTLHSSNVYDQKQVRWLEWDRIFTNFSERSDPNTEELAHLVRPFKKPYRRPWDLPHVQMPPAKTSLFYTVLGLQATNLYYSYILAAVYGVTATIVFRYLITPADEFTLTFVAIFVILIGALLIGSHLIIGSGFEIIVLESNLAFNSLMLIAIEQGIISYSTAITALQLVTALIAAPLVFWLTFQFRHGNLGYGNFVPAYFVIVPILYAEFFILTLGLVYS